MRVRRKPDSSWSSNRLTKSDLPVGGHLLSTFNKSKANNPSADKPELETTAKPDPATDEEPPGSFGDLNDVEEKPKPAPDSDDKPLSSIGELSDPPSSIEDLNEVAKPRPEPATDEEPISSTEEDPSDDDLLQSFGDEKNKKTLENKLADEGYGNPKKRSAPASSGFADSDDELSIWPSSFLSSQGSKRHKTNTYQSKQKPGAYLRAPSSSARSGVTSEGSSPANKTRKSKAGAKKQPAPKTNGSSEEPDVAFKVPLEINAPSPRKPRARKNQFKLPPTFPTESISHSSLGTSSSKDPQPMMLDDGSPASSLSTALSSPSSPIFGGISREEGLPDGSDRQPSPPRKALCPMCKAEVDPEMLLRFEAQPKQRVREQQHFCASHKQDSAEKEWKAQGYPEIDWDTFDERVQRHFSGLERFMVPDCSSYYRNILDSTLKSGKAKNFRLTLAGDGLETISCGYYGTKGAGKILQAVIDRYSLKLRRLAASDHIVKTAGVAGYAQTVLVPELAVQLVKEDMGVADDSARQILRESIDLGEKLNPTLDDVVPLPAEAEDHPRD
ncbi:hypothetical protein NUU61_009235 [Penicillium alfredii]|uniref:Restriction of telomere capping protein 4 n=1 Tax=Penicillium alfredii TaxID=1506179 RepID=A0A9W9EN04_9EURO|nr:uncharacterized protein NUU61_009235 [Penicillium alfredii]KAJ5084656.1 hypothetical protein NUU61_009235 [Penicillium alfredii]